LGLAFHPSYETNGFFYVAYTEAAPNSADPPQNDLVVARYAVSPNPDVADATSKQILLKVFQPFQNHNGGHLAFGPDGFLYIGLGDGGAGGDPGNRAQNLDTLLGKLLRIDVDSADPGRNYSVPASNPFAADAPAGCSESCLAPPCGTTCDEIWAYGLRHPWRFSFDRESGDLYLGDVGQGFWEEVDFQAQSSPGGENYGWHVMEGTHCYPPRLMDSCTPPANHTPPVLEYNQGTAPGCSVTGGFVYRGVASPQLRGVYLFADFCFGTIWGTVPRCDGAWQFQELLDTPFSIASFGEDEAGELYVADLADVSGEVYRLGLAPSSGGPVLEVSPGTIDFGGAVGSTLEVTLTNASIGPEALFLEDLALVEGSDFALDLAGGGAPCVMSSRCLSPGESCTVTVSFTGSGTAWFLDRLSTTSNSALAEVAVGACTEAANRTIENVEIGGGQETFDACESLTVGPGFVVASTGAALLRAGVRVILGSGTTIAGGLEIQTGLP
jgi:hypothetical protein